MIIPKIFIVNQSGRVEQRTTNSANQTIIHDSFHASNIFLLIKLGRILTLGYNRQQQWETGNIFAPWLHSTGLCS